MNFLIITHVEHIYKDSIYYGYGPYVREMNIWIKEFDSVTIVAPLIKEELNPIYATYQHNTIRFFPVPTFSLISILALLKTFFTVPLIFFTICRAMSKADHIHLRCPGNMGLIGSIAQIFFPKTKKTAKYAGNWDPNSKQPWSYRLQKWILSSTFLTKNMQVLVYGDWENKTKNIKPFFTATYSEEAIQSSNISPQPLALEESFCFIFVGTLSKGKQPIYAIQLVNQLHKMGKNVMLDLYGDGVMRNEIASYIKTNSLESFITLKGNQSKEIVEKAYQESHFLLLPSKSEGWPKVVAEAMFWGCLPIVTKVSCVPYMLNNGDRGILIDAVLENDVLQIETVLKSSHLYNEKANNARKWSRAFTVEKFENEIKKLLQ